MTTITLTPFLALFLALLFTAVGLLFGFAAGIDWHRRERNASMRILHENGVGERRMYVTRNGRLIGLDGGKK